MVALLLNTKEAAKALGISDRKLRELAAKNAGPPSVAIGRKKLYQPSDLKDFIEACRSLPRTTDHHSA